MRTIIHASAFATVVLGMLAAAGCNLEHNVDEKKKFDMKPNDVAWYNLDSGTAKQKKFNVIMKATPPGCTVAVAVVLKEDFDSAKDAMKKNAEPPRYLECHKDGADFVEFKNIVIKEKTPFTVILVNRSDESVTAELKVKGK
jgi:hypothetical protein